MKKIFPQLLAGIIGGLIVLGGFLFMTPHVSSSIEQPATKAKNVNLLNVPAGTANVPFDFTAAADKAMPAVVHIHTEESKSAARDNQQQERGNPFRFFFDDDFFGNPFGGMMPRKGSGSGVIISDDGYIVTNNHVIEFGDQIVVTTNDGRKFDAQKVGTDAKSDLAVIKIDGYDLDEIKFANSDNAKVGEWVLAVGNPFDLASTVTAGIISAKGRDIDIIKEQGAIEEFIQTDAAVNPGNSGGALVNTDGDLIGINTAIMSKTGSYVGYSFAIPVNLMKKIVDDIIKYGSFQRGSLGVFVEVVDEAYAKELGIDQKEGILITSLVDGCSAQYAGILPNDIILKVDGQKVSNFPALQDAVSKSKKGETLELTIWRKGKTQKVPVRMKSC